MDHLHTLLNHAKTLPFAHIGQPPDRKCPYFLFLFHLGFHYVCTKKHSIPLLALSEHQNFHCRQYVKLYSALPFLVQQYNDIYPHGILYDSPLQKHNIAQYHDSHSLQLSLLLSTYPNTYHL